MVRLGGMNLIGNYQLIVTDSKGCQRVSNLIIGQPTQLTVTEVIKDVSCNAGNDGQISLNISGGNPFSSGPNYIINWKLGGCCFYFRCEFILYNWLFFNFFYFNKFTIIFDARKIRIYNK